MKNKLTFFFDNLLNLLGLISGALIVSIMLIVGVHVVGRYIFHRPIAWVIDFSEYALLFIVFLGSAWLLKNDGHVTMDILIRRLSSKSRNFLKFVTSIFGAIICFVILWYSALTTFDNYQRGILLQEAVTLPKYIILCVIPLGTFLLMIQFIRRAYNSFYN